MLAYTFIADRVPSSKLSTLITGWSTDDWDVFHLAELLLKVFRLLRCFLPLPICCCSPSTQGLEHHRESSLKTILQFQLSQTFRFPFSNLAPVHQARSCVQVPVSGHQALMFPCFAVQLYLVDPDIIEMAAHNLRSFECHEQYSGWLYVHALTVVFRLTSPRRRL